VDPNQFCSDPDPASHVHSDPDLALEPSMIQIHLDLDTAQIFQINLKSKLLRQYYF
jgi:hypothetical protein